MDEIKAMNTQIVWLIQGKIKDKDQFKEVSGKLFIQAKQEPQTLLYWWALGDKEELYYDLDCYNDSNAAIDHLKNWAKLVDEFKKCATIEKMTVYGHVSDELQEELKPFNPLYLDFFGGFWKNDTTMSDSDIIWMLDGHVTERARFANSMHVLTAHINEEPGSRSHWWCVSPDGYHFNVIERYKDVPAAMAHLSTWNKYGHLFLESTDIESYKIFSNIPDEMKNDLAGLKPTFLHFYQGFAK